MTMSRGGIEPGFVRSDVTGTDGVRLAVYDRPGPADDAPVLFLVNGLGGNLVAWRHVLNHFSERFRIATWDYRGLYASCFGPRAESGIPLGIDAHANDAVTVLDALGIDKAVFVGWSMGVQLNFELTRRIGDRMEALVQVAGSYGRSLSTTRFGKPGEALILPAMGAFRRVLDWQGGLIDKAVNSGLLMRAAKGLGFVAPSLDEALASEIAASYLALDFEVYNQILASLGEHDAEDVLAGLTMPVLIVAGDKDPMTPHWLSEKMANVIPRAELVIVRGGSHYVPVEFPDRVNRTLEDFFERRVFA